MHAPHSRRPLAFTATELLVVIVCVAVVFFFLLLPAEPTGKAKATRLNCVINLKNIGLAWRIYATDSEASYPWLHSATNRPPVLPTNFVSAPGASLSPGQGGAAIFGLITNELSTPKILQCPSDTKRLQLKANSFGFLLAPAQVAVRDRAVSYFIGTSASEEAPQSIMGGDRNLAGGPFSLDPQTPPSQVALRIPHASATNSAAMNAAVWTQDIHQGAGNLLLGDGSVQQVTSGRMREQFRDAALSPGSDLDFVWAAN
jgi:hypothetical protein